MFFLLSHTAPRWKMTNFCLVGPKNCSVMPFGFRRFVMFLDKPEVEQEKFQDFSLKM